MPGLTQIYTGMLNDAETGADFWLLQPLFRAICISAGSQQASAGFVEEIFWNAQTAHPGWMVGWPSSRRLTGLQGEGYVFWA
jgi:hypothetical protein